MNPVVAAANEPVATKAALPLPSKSGAWACFLVAIALVLRFLSNFLPEIPADIAYVAGGFALLAGILLAGRTRLPASPHPHPLLRFAVAAWIAGAVLVILHVLGAIQSLGGDQGLRLAFFAIKILIGSSILFALLPLAQRIDRGLLWAGFLGELLLVVFTIGVQMPLWEAGSDAGYLETILSIISLASYGLLFLATVRIGLRLKGHRLVQAQEKPPSFLSDCDA